MNQLLDENNQNHCITLHFVSASEEVETREEVEMVIKVLEEYEKSMIPLHTAATKGHEDEIRAYVSTCPESLQMVSLRQETALHLALKYNQVGAFKVLIEEVKKHHLEELLNLGDHEGNTVLHIAVFNKLLEIVKLLLPDRSTNGAVLMQVNSKNNSGLTALDVYRRLYPADSLSMEIGRILYEAGAVEGHSTGQPSSETETVVQPSRRNAIRRVLPAWSMETRNVLLVVLVLFAGEALDATLNPHSVFLKGNNAANATIFHAREVVAGQLPLIFYYMGFVATIFTVAMGVIAVLIWSLPFGAILLFALVMTFIGYVVIVDKTMPKFSVNFGSTNNISCSSLVWICVGAIIFSGFMVCSTVKNILMFLHGFVKWPKTRTSGVDMGQY